MLFPSQSDRTRNQVVRHNCVQANSVLAVRNAWNGRQWHGSSQRIHQRATLPRLPEVVRAEARRHLTQLRFISPLPSLALLLDYHTEPRPASSPNINSSEVQPRPTRLQAFQLAARVLANAGFGCPPRDRVLVKELLRRTSTPGGLIGCSWPSSAAHVRRFRARVLPSAVGLAVPCESKEMWGLQGCLHFLQPVFQGLPGSGRSLRAAFSGPQSQSFFLMGQEVLPRRRVRGTQLQGQPAAANR